MPLYSAVISRPAQEEDTHRILIRGAWPEDHQVYVIGSPNIPDPSLNRKTTVELTPMRQMRPGSIRLQTSDRHPTRRKPPGLALSTSFTNFPTVSSPTGGKMDFSSSLGETDRKVENGDLVDNLGNYMGIFGITFFFVSVLQMLASKFLICSI